MTVAAPPPDVATEALRLVEATGALRRNLRRRLRTQAAAPLLHEAERELVLLVDRAPGLGVGDAARRLALAPNTVSTLVGALVRRGLVERRVDGNDRRTARLSLTDAAQRRVADWRDQRRRIVALGLERLPLAERDAIARAVPALERLAAAIEEAS